MRPLPERGYGYAPGVFQYSCGVAALPGFRLERARFRKPVPLAEGFARIKAHMTALGVPLTAFAACELRSPAPFTEDGFAAFNRIYAGTLQEWGVFIGEENPVARSNVCPEVSPPAEPGFHAFTYAVPDVSAGTSFVIAGNGEAKEGGATYRESVVAYGDTSPAGLSAKCAHVMTEMERRMQTLGVWYDTATAVNLYTVFDPHPILAQEILGRGAPALGLEWHFCRPPIEGLDWEMDCRGIPKELVL
ncbi:2-amino-5-chloromuconate deaminase CnbZ [Rhodovarius lipocyclicus]|uniref:2-amino-5-chloromuconate deaminase CnbZ n=1 Tax=Rhodovarius lipocyclicus TaxID=268410 RepID=UPI001916F7E0|nr:hypothetical protein [Rhodovarius lipocyclicus]